MATKLRPVTRKVRPLKGNCLADFLLKIVRSVKVRTNIAVIEKLGHVKFGLVTQHREISICNAGKMIF